MKAILFDLDGNLVDSFDCWLSAFNDTMEKFGKRKVGEREYREKYQGRGVRSIFEKLGLGDDAIKYCTSRLMNNLDKIEVFPETKKILESLSKKFKLGIVTNAMSDFVHKTLEYFDLKKYFDVIVTVDDVKERKPDPEMVIKACKLLGLDPSDVIVVGDEKNDVLAGKSAGCVVVGLNREGDYKIKSLLELEKLVERLSRSSCQ